MMVMVMMVILAMVMTGRVITAVARLRRARGAAKRQHERREAREADLSCPAQHVVLPWWLSIDDPLIGSYARGPVMD
jgi:hypothetical protein